MVKVRNQPSSVAKSATMLADRAAVAAIGPGHEMARAAKGGIQDGRGGCRIQPHHWGHAGDGGIRQGLGDMVAYARDSGTRTAHTVRPAIRSGFNQALSYPRRLAKGIGCLVPVSVEVIFPLFWALLWRRPV
jgi:hypothetical protein